MHFTSYTLHEITLNVSQAITSNGDGINDTWIIENITYHPKAKISVFSRWGVEVFTSSGNHQNDWAGLNKTIRNHFLTDRTTIP